MQLERIINKDRLEENTYVITEGQKALVIDPGKPEGGDAHILMDYLKDNDIKEVTVFLTHGHHDHIGAIPDILQAYPFTKVYLDSIERILNFNKALFKLVDQTTYLKIIDICENVFDVLEWNNHKFPLISVPGHTGGSLMLEVDDLKAYFSGDFLFKDDIGYVFEESGGSAKKMKESLNKMKSLKQDYTVYPGHGEPTNMGYEVDNNYYINTPLESWQS